MENTPRSELNPELITAQYAGAADEHEFLNGINETNFRGCVPREEEQPTFHREHISTRNVRREMTPLQRAYWQIQGDAIFEEPSAD